MGVVITGSVPLITYQDVTLAVYNENKKIYHIKYT